MEGGWLGTAWGEGSGVYNESHCEYESAMFCCCTILGYINKLILYKTCKQLFHSGSGRCISWHIVSWGVSVLSKRDGKRNERKAIWVINHGPWWPRRRRGSLVQERERQSEFWHFLLFGWLTVQSCQSPYSIAFVSFLMSVFLQFNKVNSKKYRDSVLWHHIGIPIPHQGWSTDVL